MPFKVFTNGVPLPASDLNDYLMEQVIASFPDSTARAAQLTSPTQGQLTYLVDVDKHQFWSGAAWADFGTGQTLISDTNLSGAGASVTLSSIPQIYSDLKLVIRGYRPVTDAIALRMRINGVTTGYTTETGNSSDGTLSATSWQITDVSDNGVNTSLAVVSLFDYANSTTWKIAKGQSVVSNATNAANFENYCPNLISNTTAAISSITLFPSSGNFNAGQVLLYGVK